jgi:hypothetical protein
LGWASGSNVSHRVFVPEKIKPSVQRPLTEKTRQRYYGAIFKYIDNKTERSVEATIKTLATKDDIADVRKEISEAKTETIKWMFIFWIGQVGATLGILLLFLKK